MHLSVICSISSYFFLCVLHFINIMSLYYIFVSGKPLDGLPRWLSSKDAEDTGSIPGRSLGEGNGNPIHHSCHYNPKTRGARWPIIHGLQRVGNDWTSKKSFWKYHFLFVWCIFLSTYSSILTSESFIIFGMSISLVSLTLFCLNNKLGIFWGAPKSLQMEIVAMKLKEAYSLERKLWPT